jgi:hypothetical protein
MKYKHRILFSKFFIQIEQAWSLFQQKENCSYLCWFEYRCNVHSDTDIVCFFKYILYSTLKQWMVVLLSRLMLETFIFVF